LRVRCSLSLSLIVECMWFAYVQSSTASFLRLNASTTDRSICKPPDGNTILAIVGGWLFEAIHTYQVLARSLSLAPGEAIDTHTTIAIPSRRAITKERSRHWMLCVPSFVPRPTPTTISCIWRASTAESRRYVPMTKRFTHSFIPSLTWS